MIVCKHRNDPIGRQHRRGFTLVELLVVIALMSILSAMMAYALSGARQEGRIKRAQSEVRMISQILQSKMNEIALSKLELKYSSPANPSSPSGPSPNAARERSRLVVMARRDLMRLVMPTCRADLIYPPANLQFRTQNGSTGLWLANCAKVAVPSEWNRMRGLIRLRSAGQADNYFQLGGGTTSPTELPGFDSASLYAAGGTYKEALDTYVGGTPSSPSTPINWSRQFESAECLYLILASTELFGETAIDKIHARSIANLDGDDVPEIIDPWGRPYEFIRDPIGLDAPAIKNYDPSAAVADQYPVDPDPLDFLLSDWRYDDFVNPPSTAPPNERFYPVYLPPVVISAGPDGEFDLRRTFYSDESNTPQGVNDNYSTAMITWTATSLSPLYPDPFSSGVLPYRFPDPFYNVSAITYSAGSTPAYNITNSDLGQVDLAKQGGGLGGYVDTDGYDAKADNITSLDGGF